MKPESVNDSLDPAWLLALAERRKAEGQIDAPLTLTLDQQIAVFRAATGSSQSTPRGSTHE